MNTSCMKNVFKKLAFPLVTCGLLLAGTTARAQIVYGDVCSIHPGDTYTQPIRTSGSTVDIRVRLFSPYGNFTREYLGGLSETVADVLSPFQMRVVTGNGIAYAKLTEVNNYSAQRTELRFQYTVRAGDLAYPMTIYGSAGNSTAGTPFSFNDGQWRIYNIGTGSNVVWRYVTPALMISGEVIDPDFSAANVRLQTLAFETVPDPWTVQATKTLVATVNTDTAVSNTVPFYVWSANTNIAQIVEQASGSPSALLYLPAGSASTTFRIKGKTLGTTTIYMSPAPTLTAGLTNYVTKTVVVTEPPPPTVSVTLSTGVDSNGLMRVTLDESDSAVNTLKVTLSETYTDDVWIRLDTTPVGQTNMAFQVSPMYVQVAKGYTESGYIQYTAKDGLGTVQIVPVLTNAAANAYFTIKESATVVVRNVKPSVTSPVANTTVHPYTLTPFDFPWEISDVAADTASGMTVTWNFGDGTTNQVSHGAIGTMTHTFQAAGTYTVTVTARDKDGSTSDPISFFASVADPVPVPTVSVVTDKARYSETNGTGSFRFVLSKPYISDVYVSLTATPVGQTNVVLGLTDYTVISAGETNSSTTFNFAILDGTPESRLTGVVLTPVLSNNTYYAARATRVYIDNQQPTIAKPVVGSSVGPVPATVPYSFQYDVRDVDADKNSIITTWDFGDGSNPLVLTGATGRAWHTFATPGTMTVTMSARDKDYQSGDVSAEAQFTVVVGSAPTVTVLSPSGAIYETPNSGEKDYITVQLSSAYTNAVTVNLAVTPANSALNGTMTLEKTQVIFPAGNIGEVKEQKVYIASVKDGTDISSGTGFTITPSVSATPGAVSFYGNNTNMVAGEVRILNVAPTLNQPTAPASSTEISAEIPQNGSWTFYWDITDVSIDQPTLSTVWYWGDGTTSTVLGRSGSVSHVYTSVGDITIHVVTTDKDGGFDDVYFKVRVSPAKSVNVTPVGPVFAGAYAGAPGLGNGLIFSEDAVTRYIEQDVYFFKYSPGLTAANLVAVPYKTGASTYYRLTNYIARVNGLPGSTAIGTPASTNAMDSFFYVWVGADQGLPAEALVPLASPVAAVSLPASQTTTDGTASSTTSVEIRQVQAVFSREYRASDNIGDINNDGIPDPIAIYYNLPTLLGSDLISALGYNDDNDFLPGAATDNVGLINGTSNTWAAVGRPFTAFLEIRGYHEGLNSTRYNSDPDYGPGEEDAFLTLGISPERPTSPITDDTDGDGYPDGWEYYFWYNAFVNHLTGRKYNPNDVASGMLLDWPEIYAKFDPIVPATDSIDKRDLDGDGLLDMEELATGLNPIDWDSDADGMCDGWEILRGLNPSLSDDGLDSAKNNPDGDYMAIATVPREFVTVSDGEGNVIGTYLRDAAGNTTTWYNYGTSNAPIAVGRPVTLPAGEESSYPTNALILHFQVYQELGFDPRTAWTDQVGRGPSYVSGTAPNTKPFTSVDEYLLMKFMSENRVNNATATMIVDEKLSDWKAFSTHPLTPNTDHATSGTDNMPDGWELYVACAPGTRTMGISPWDAGDAVQSDEDRLTNDREFGGTESSAKYASAALYGAGIATVSITRPAADANWVNKFWPTDPWNLDTDGDTLPDHLEAATQVPVSFLMDGSWWTVGDTTLQYGGGTDTGAYCVRGGGLNPCSMDSDWDGLTDTWEYDHAGTNAISGVTGYAYIESGMDGTHGPGNQTLWSYGDAFTTWDILVTGSGAQDRNMDFDQDGLENYQEYWVQAVRHFRYDYTDAAIPMDGSAGPDVFFTPITNVWDYAQYGAWLGTPASMLLPVGFGYYVSTDPREPDTDFDGMDDYYEMFHGLNPILGDSAIAEGDRVAYAYLYFMDGYHNGWNANPSVALPMDFKQYPWLAGVDEADPDVDGLRNLEEQIQPDTAAASCSNTDPTPIWMTDVSSPESYTARFYGAGSVYLWGFVDDTFKVFSFEMNEGFDTDNDGVSDKAELLQTSTAQSEPQDQDDPLRRQAIWFDGVQSAAQTLVGYAYDEWAFRSFTVEFWAMPEVVDRDQVLIERPVVYGPSDLSTTTDVVRVNFRVGIAADGRVYAMFQNAGVHDDYTGKCVAYGRVLNAGEWVHIAARLDGSTGKFELLVNGEIETTVATSLIPANGVVNILSDPDSTQYPTPYSYTVTPGLVVLGASNGNPFPDGDPDWADYDGFFQGFMDEVRVWDGARSNNEILENYTRRFSTADLEQNLADVTNSLAAGGSRIIGATLQLPAELIYHYTFDNLFSADVQASVAKEPRGFNNWAVVTNRPDGYVVGWWDALPTHSLVYDDYGYIPWIENKVEHMPITNGVVRNSFYWSQMVAGELKTLPAAHGLAEYTFPNVGNPYGLRYVTGLMAGGQAVASDLLPLGNAWAKQVTEMWDDGSPSGVWAETGEDLDADGLADWWEIAVAGSTDVYGWYDLYGSSGMTAGERYLRDIATGWTETKNPSVPGYDPNTLIAQTADADADGLPDWWENIYNLKVDDATGDNGATGDPDRDGLSNYAEYLISERYPFNRLLRPNQFKSSATQTVSDYFLKSGYLYYGQMFADHDFIEDWWEDQFDPSYINRYVYDAHQDNDDDGWSNWAECRYESWISKSSPELVARTSVNGDMEYNFPIPVVETTLRYNGIHSSGNIVVYAYSDPEMDGKPTATYTMAYGANTSSATDKSYPIGYWENRVVTGFMSPGSVQPGTISFNFTDMWTGLDADTGFDFDGVLYAGSISGYMEPVGTINYDTGEFTFDMGIYQYSIIPLTDQIQKRVDYIDCEISYIVMHYGVTLPDAWPKKLYLSLADDGYLREGTNYFFAFMDLDNSGSWAAGEPCGVAKPFVTDIGWSRNELNVELTDYTPGYLRMEIATGRRSEDIYFGTAAQTSGGSATTAGLGTHVRIVRKSVDGLTAYRRVVLDKVIDSSRDFLHEGDALAAGEMALDWGLVGVPTTLSRLSAAYELYTGDAPDAALTNGAVAVFTNTFDAARAKAVTTYPINGSYVYAARPTFKWTMPDNYTAFAIEIKKGSSTGTTIYSPSAVQAPSRDMQGNYVWKAPIYADGRIPSSGQIFSANTVYAWRIMAMNSKYANTTISANWSDWKLFRLDVNAPVESSGYGAINARVKYHGPAKSLLANRVKVQAFRTASFSGLPDAEYTLTAADLNVMTSSTVGVNAVLKGLSPSSTMGTYYVRAFIDHNESGSRDVWESWGYANYYGQSTIHPYDPRGVTVDTAAAIPVVDITIEDADSDQDWFPDAWEYEKNPTGDFLDLVGPSTAADADPEVNPWLSLTSNLGRTGFFIALSSGTTDLDGDGLGDLAELALASDASSASSSGDGYSDGDKLSLGLAPADTLSLSLTGLDTSNPTSPVVQWSVGVEKATDVNRSLISALSTVTDGVVGFEILYTPSLDSPAWRTVKTGTVTLSGVQTLVSEVEATTLDDAAKGFFRVRLVSP